MDVLSRVAGVVGDIIKAPVRFLGNLISGVKGGILKFKDNILDHLRKGLMTWLFGELAEGGVELPDKFDLEGIIKLLASLFGLTWRNIRNRIVRQVGEKAMAAIEKGVEIFQILSSTGVAGLWQMLLEKLGDIKEMILEQAKDFVVTRIITAGISWLIGLLNPVGAFIKACKLIYDVVMFFVNNAERIVTFVNTVLDSVADMVRGNVGAVVTKVEDALSQMVPILIGFLASVLGIGGIGEKIRQIVGKLRKPITKAIDSVIKTGLQLAAPIIRGLKGIGGKVKAKVAAGKAWVKGKIYGGDDSPEGKQKRLEMGMRAGVALMNRYAGKRVAGALLTPGLAAIRLRYGMTQLEPRQQGARWALHGAVNPTETTTTEAEPPTAAEGGLEPPAGKTEGAIALYRGIHYDIKMTEEDYKKATTQKFEKRTEFSAGARALADSNKPDGSDVPEKTLIEAAQTMQLELAKERQPGKFTVPWHVSSKKWSEFKSRFNALLHLFIDDMDKFRDVIKDPDKALSLGFWESPFISTSRSAMAAVKYAKGKLAGEHQRKEGIVGKVYIYLFKVADLARQQAVDPVKLTKDKLIGLSARRMPEGEVTFMGSIPGENLEDQMAVFGDRPDEFYEAGAKDKAREKAKAYGGLV